MVKKAQVRLLVKREDLNHPFASGNKWWKLKYNLETARALGHDTILTFGGARANHIYATAAAASELGFRCIGVIRGEPRLPLNPTLRFAADHGMKLHHVTRSDYRQKETTGFVNELEKKFGRFCLIPEGGTNALAIRGCAEFGALIDEIPADYICLPVGTAGTMAGIILGTTPNKKVIGFSVLKNGDFLQSTIEQYAAATAHRWQLITEYAYGGYAKRSDIVDAFMKNFSLHSGIPLDFIYTGKMMCGLFELLEQGFFERGKTILAVHTGGLQGNIPYR